MKNPQATRWIVLVYALALAVGTSDAAAQSKRDWPSKPAQESAASPGPKAPMRSCQMDRGAQHGDMHGARRSSEQSTPKPSAPAAQ
jgi:uncharacterized protein involved in copper resistance